MYAIHSGGHVLAVTADQLRALIDKFLDDLDDFERLSIKMAHSDIQAFGSKEHAKKYPQWERLLISRIQRNVTRIPDLLSFNLRDADARKYIPDLLEAYRGNHIGEFAWSMDEHLGSLGDRAISVEMFDRPGLIDRLTRRDRAPRNKHVFNLSAVRSVSGTAMGFTLKCTTFSLRFTSSGDVLREQGSPGRPAGGSPQ
jgi:hypothetical protein